MQLWEGSESLTAQVGIWDKSKALTSAAARARRVTLNETILIDDPGILKRA
jgi:hypothetical protein